MRGLDVITDLMNMSLSNSARRGRTGQAVMSTGSQSQTRLSIGGGVRSVATGSFPIVY